MSSLAAAITGKTDEQAVKMLKNMDSRGKIVVDGKVYKPIVYLSAFADLMFVIPNKGKDISLHAKRL